MWLFRKKLMQMAVFLQGRLLYSHAPAGVTSTDFHCAAPSVKPVKLNKAAQQAAQSKQSSTVDTDFFKQVLQFL